MNQHTEKQLSLAETLPAFPAELRQLLEQKGEPELAAQVPELMIFDRCRCGKENLRHVLRATQTAKNGFGPGHRNVRLMPELGMLILDVVAGEIACVEIFDRDHVGRSWMRSFREIRL